MDDEEIYGEVFLHKNFGWAVENNLLTDYKVVVLAVDEELLAKTFRDHLKKAPS